MKDFLKNLGKLAPLGLGVLTIDSYARGVTKADLQKAVDNNAKKVAEQLQALESEVKNLNDSNTIVTNKLNSLSDFIISAYNEAIASSKEIWAMGSEINTMTTNYLKIKNPSSVEQLEYYSKVTEVVEKYNSKSEELVSNLEVLRDFVKKGFEENSSKFRSIEDIQNFIISYQDWLNTLSVSHRGAILHLCFSVTILFCLVSMISVFIGDQLIIYYNLENKFPRLARFIQLRRKFKKYYFMLDSLIILFS